MRLKFGKMLISFGLLTLPLVCFGAADRAAGEKILSSLSGSGTPEQRKTVANLIEFIYEAAKEPANVKFENVKSLSRGKLRLGSCYELTNSYRRCSYDVTESEPHESNVYYFYTDTANVESDKGMSLGIVIDTATVCLPAATLSKLWAVAPEKADMPIGDVFGPESEIEDVTRWSAEIYRDINPGKKYVSLKTYLKNDCVSMLILEANNFDRKKK